MPLDMDAGWFMFDVLTLSLSHVVPLTVVHSIVIDDADLHLDSHGVA